MSKETITVNDDGTRFEITIIEGDTIVDVSAATAVEIEFTDPGGRKKLRTASNVNDGSDGQIFYKSVTSDIDRKGDWSYRGIATFSPTEKYHSYEPVSFTVVD